MIGYILKKIFNALLVMAGVIVIIFFLFAVLPADPAQMISGQRTDSATVNNIKRELGLDQPLSVQFLMYANDLSPISFYNLKNKSSAYFADSIIYKHALKIFSTSSGVTVMLKQPYFRRSYQSNRSVGDVLAEKIPGTAVLAFASILFATFFGIIFGIISALFKDTFIDRATLAISVSGMAVPSFFVAIIVAWIFGFVLNRYTGLNMTGSLFSIDPFDGEYLDLKNLILPTFVLGIRPLSIITQLTRSSLLDVLSQDYIRTAKAKGLAGFAIISKHALRNALNPVVTAISGWLGSLLAGAVFVEFIFGWDGLGKLTVQALENYDMPVIMGIVIFISFVFIIINLLADLAYAMLDPRMRKQ